MSNSNTLWIGDIEPWMDDVFVKQIFQNIAPIKSIKVMRKNGQSIGYGFIEFEDDETTTYVLQKYNGSKINGYSKPLKLSRAVFNGTKIGEDEIQIYICDMDLNVTEDILREYFKERYPSVIAAKIICDPSTRISKGYGFVKFRNMEEANNAVKEMNGKMLLTRPVRVK